MIRKLSLKFLLFVTLAFLAAACSSNDTIEPVSTLQFPPDQIFFNGASSFAETPVVRFIGTAEDNVWVNTVEISFDDGVSWTDAVIEGQGARVTWYYEAMSSELMTNSAIQVRAKDLSGNLEMTGSGQAYTKTVGAIPSDLEDLVNNAGTASTNDTIYLSSGAGGAYGDTGANGLTLANTNPITIVGNGFDQTIAVGGISAITATSKTFLATSQSAPALITAGDDLYLRSLRIIGGQVGALASTNGPIQVTVDDCVVAGFEGWGVKAEDLDGGSDVMVLVEGSLIDASDANNVTVRHGGVLLDDVLFNINGSVVMNHNTSGGNDSALYVGGGGGTVSDSYFAANRSAIWVSNSSPVIDSCSIIGDPIITPTTGVVFTGSGPSSNRALLSNSLVDGNSGFGVMIRGGTAPILYRNTISNNKESGVVFDGNFSGAVFPNLGRWQASAPESGQNTFRGNTRSNSIVGGNIFVTQTSQPGAPPFTAQQNYWVFVTPGEIDATIWDGLDWNPVPSNPVISFTPFQTVPP